MLQTLNLYGHSAWNSPVIETMVFKVNKVIIMLLSGDI